MQSGTAGGAVKEGYRKSRICWLPKNRIQYGYMIGWET